MKSEKFFKFLQTNGNIEVMNFLFNANDPIQFKQLRNLINPKTSKKYSSATISKNLKFLEEENIIINKIVKKYKQKIIGYSLTKKGKNTLDILKEAEEKYEKIKNI